MVLDLVAVGVPGQTGGAVDGLSSTVSATQFAAWTGTSRERLRTWERRHGFPATVRHVGGRRRYLAEDVARVVAVRRAVEAGVPLREAIARSARAAARTDVGPHVLSGVADAAPLAVAVVSGPRPLRVAWTNGVLRAAPGAPRPGEVLDEVAPAWLTGGAADALRRRFAPGAVPAELEHPAWDAGGPARSAVFALPVGPDAVPLVALVGLEAEGERRLGERLAAAEAEVEALRRRDERHERWLTGLAEVAGEFQREPGSSVVPTGLDALVRAVRALDATLATYAAGRLEVPPSRGGTFGDTTVTVAAHPRLALGLRDHEGLWADPALRTAFGVPQGRQLALVPVVNGGAVLGAMGFLFDAVDPHDADNRRLLAVMSATMGFAMLRDQLTRELAQAAGA